MANSEDPDHIAPSGAVTVRSGSKSYAKIGLSKYLGLLQNNSIKHNDVCQSIACALQETK